MAALVLAVGCAHNPAPRPHVVARAAAAASPRPDASRGPEPDAATSPRPAPDGSALPGRSGNPSAVDRTTPGFWHLPLTSFSDATVIGRFGDPRDGGSRAHEGIDLAAPRGTPVLAPLPGRIVVSGTRSLGGNVVVLVDEIQGYEMVFSHLDERWVRQGQRVAAGAALGTVGTTGNARGGPPHLHFEVHLATGPIDPYPLLGKMAALSAGQ